MQNLWAPWRAEYFTITKPEGCVFCTAASQGHSDQSADPHYLLVREKTCFAMLNAYPYTGGHLMVAPYKHTGNLEDLTEDELRDILILARRCKVALDKSIKPHGYNMGFNLGEAAGAGIPDHLHFHVVPRWNGDTNFMTVLAQNRIISEGLKETHAKIMSQLSQ
jgi:ATP adenylyltransferase